jgi:uncharacterized protein YbaR (Trm112 family)
VADLRESGPAQKIVLLERPRENEFALESEIPVLSAEEQRNTQKNAAVAEGDTTAALLK